MKVLFVPALFGDFNLGLERTLSAMIDGFNNRGMTVDVAVSKPLDLASVRRNFSVQLRDVRLVHVPGWGVAAKGIPIVGKYLANQLNRRGFRQLTAQYDLAFVQSAFIPQRSAAGRSVLFTEFPRDKAPTARDWRQRLNSYNLVIGNSQFTCEWIERYWDHPAEVFYPSIQECEPLAKDNVILGVGRFTQGGREKGQLEMTEIFRALVDEGLSGWKLVLAGFPGSEQYVAAVRDKATGYPVELQLGLSAEELKSLYGRASIFWHTTGMGVDQDQEPQRCEHFGIVVAEAMTAGCVPLVFGAGGPREIVDNPDLCWSTTAELQSKTTALIREPDRLVALAQQCRQSAVARFGHAAFDRSIDRLLSPAP